MKLHPSVIEKIIQIYQNHGGFDSDKRLREHLKAIELVVYERKQLNAGESVLVLAEDFIKQISGR